MFVCYDSVTQKIPVIIYRSCMLWDKENSLQDNIRSRHSLSNLFYFPGVWRKIKNKIKRLVYTISSLPIFSIPLIIIIIYV